MRHWHIAAFALALLPVPAGAAAAPSVPPARQGAACDKGDAKACYDLGLRYEEGDGVRKNPARAVTLHERSCNLGDGGACWYIGSAYETGNSGQVVRDASRAAALYRQGCDKGNGDACFSLGLLYKAGNGVPYNPAAAAAFIRKGCVDLASGFCEDAGGLAVAMSGLGRPARPQPPSRPPRPATPARAPGAPAAAQ